MRLALPLFSFGWTNPAMLAWLAAAAVPLLIHLWSRRNYREVPWASHGISAGRHKTANAPILVRAMAPVGRSHRANRDRRPGGRRTLLATSRPCAGREGQHPSHARARRFLLDGLPTNRPRPAFDRAKELARQIVGQSPQGDAFTLVLMSSPPRVLVAAPALDPAEIIREIDALRLPQTTADLPATIAAVRQVVDAVAA